MGRQRNQTFGKNFGNGMSDKSIVVINHLTSGRDVAALASKLHLTLDVTNFDLKRLPTHVRAAIWSEASAFVAPTLRACEDINAANAIDFSAPLLQSARNLYLPQVTRFHAPRLANCAYLHAPLLTFPTAAEIQKQVCSRLIRGEGWVGVSFRQAPPSDTHADIDGEGHS
jgi:hypothetical protein